MDSLSMAHQFVAECLIIVRQPDGLKALIAKEGETAEDYAARVEAFGRKAKQLTTPEEARECVILAAFIIQNIAHMTKLDMEMSGTKLHITQDIPGAKG